MSTITLSTHVIGPVDTTAPKLKQYLQRDPRPIKYNDSEIAEILSELLLLSKMFGFRTSFCAAQIFHETGNFRYGGDVESWQYNFAGIGATGGIPGHTFATIRLGMLAYFAHLATYVYGEQHKWPAGLAKYHTNTPRYQNVISAGYAGVIDVIGDFTNGRWAHTQQLPIGTLDNGYARSIVRIMNDILSIKDVALVVPTIEQQFIDACNKYEVPGSVTDERSRMYTNGNYPILPNSAWRYTACHYTAGWRERSDYKTELNAIIGYSRFHVATRGWPGIAYAVVITPSGHIVVTRPFNQMGYHAFNANNQAFAIAMSLGWPQEPTPESLKAYAIVLHVLHNDLKHYFVNLNGHKNTYGHKELTFLDGRNITNCPGMLSARVEKYRRVGTFDTIEIKPLDKRPDHAKIDIPGIGERWVVRNVFFRWSEPLNNVMVFGLPITGQKGNYQLFERSMMETYKAAWPEKYDVHIMRTGAAYAKITGIYDTEPFEPAQKLPGPATRFRYFTETSHNLSMGFKSYWEQYGDLDHFGYPISEEFKENDTIVQYFERARFEYHPNVAPNHHNVLLGRLGAELFNYRQDNTTLNRVLDKYKSDQSVVNVIQALKSFAND